MIPKLLRNLVVFAFFACVHVQATQPRFQLSDPSGDVSVTGDTDLTNVILDFDNVTGAYSITAQASASHPFAGSFRLNFLLNPDTGLGLSAGATLVDNWNDVSGVTSTTSRVLTGTSSALLFGAGLSCLAAGAHFPRARRTWSQ